MLPNLEVLTTTDSNKNLQNTFVKQEKPSDNEVELIILPEKIPAAILSQKIQREKYKYKSMDESMSLENVEDDSVGDDSVEDENRERNESIEGVQKSSGGYEYLSSQSEQFIFE